MKEQKEFKVNNFDLLRLLAATQVIVDHYFQHLNIQISNLSKEILYIFPGVPIFFIISGFLISASYERNNNLATYFKNRALRIFPGLWACIFVTIILISLTGINFFNKQVINWLPSQLLGVIYTPAFLANYGFGSYNGSLWTIPIELQFYIILPICYLLIPKHKSNYRFFALLIVFSVINYFFSLSSFSPHFIKVFKYYTFIPNFYLFLLGVVIQRLRIYNSSFIYNKALYWLVVYLLFCFLQPQFSDFALFFIIKNIILAFCLLSIAYTLPKTAENILKSNDISYGIYIYHGLIITVLVQEKLTAYENIFLIIIVSYLIGYLSWTFIEKPFIKRKQKTIRNLAEQW